MNPRLHPLCSLLLLPFALAACDRDQPKPPPATLGPMTVVPSEGATPPSPNPTQVEVPSPAPAVPNPTQVEVPSPAPVVPNPTQVGVPPPGEKPGSKGKPVGKGPSAAELNALPPSQPVVAQPAPAPAPPPAPAPEPAAPPPAPAPAPRPAGKVSVPQSDHIRVEVPKGLQALLDQDSRMQPWVNKVMQVVEGCYERERQQNPSATGVVVVTVTMHKDSRPDSDINSLPPQLSGLFACATSKLMSGPRMPLFSGPEGERHTLRVHFQ